VGGGLLDQGTELGTVLFRVRLPNDLRAVFHTLPGISLPLTRSCIHILFFLMARRRRTQSVANVAILKHSTCPAFHPREHFATRDRSAFFNHAVVFLSVSQHALRERQRDTGQASDELICINHLVYSLPAQEILFLSLCRARRISACFGSHFA